MWIPPHLKIWTTDTNDYDKGYLFSLHLLNLLHLHLHQLLLPFHFLFHLFLFIFWHFCCIYWFVFRCCANWKHQKNRSISFLPEFQTLGLGIVVTKLDQMFTYYIAVRVSLFLFRFHVTFNNLSVLSQQCLDVAGSSMLTFRVLPHWNIKPQTRHDSPPSHIILTPGRPVLALLSHCWAPREKAFLKSLQWLSQWSNPQTPSHKAESPLCWLQME